jgi:hypothetical protein
LSHLSPQIQLTMKRNIFSTFAFLIFGSFAAFAQTPDATTTKVDSLVPTQTDKDILQEKGNIPALDVKDMPLEVQETPVPQTTETVPLVTPPTPTQQFIEDEEEKVGSMNSNGKAKKKDTLSKNKKKKKKGNTEEGGSDDNRRRK